MDYPKNTINSREYKLKNEINIFNLKIEVIKNSVSFIINNLSTLDYLYKNKVNISSFLDILNISKENSLDSDLIFKKFDDAYKNKKILIHSMDKDNLNLEIENSNISKNSNFEIKLKKENMDINDKINLLYNEIYLMKYGNTKDNFINMNKSQNEINHINEKINNLYLKINKKEDDIKNIINENAEIVEKLSSQLNKLFENLIQYKEYIEKSIINDIILQLNCFKSLQDNSKSELNALKSYIKNPLIKYYHKHGLTLENSSETCVACHKKIGSPFGTSYMCKECKIFFCYNCGNYILNGIQDKQIHSHFLPLIFREHWKCNLCLSLYLNTPSFYCKICDFDACMNCYINSLSKNNNYFLFN